MSGVEPVGTVPEAVVGWLLPRARSVSARSAILTALVSTALLLVSPRSARAWTPPIGIPPPDFGIVESHLDYESALYDFGDGPEAYRDAGNGPYTHFVDNSAPNCADDVDGEPSYGSPEVPRCTIPGRDGDPLPAGSVVEIHGVYDYAHTSPRDLHAAGTEERPVYFRGPNAGQRPQILRAIAVIGTSYAIFENLEMRDADGDLAGGPTGAFAITDKNGIDFDSDHVVLRHSELSGNLTDGGLGIGGYGGGSQVTDVVIYDNFIHDNGDVEADFDQDVHCIAVGVGVARLWIVDNELARCSGDGVQINAGEIQQASTHHIYVGRNGSYSHKQIGLWTKQAVDVIFSQNHIYDLRPSDSSSGACIGQQYGPENVWYIANVLHDCESGIRFESDSDQGFGTRAYIVGNLIYDINNSESWSAGNPHDSGAIVLRGGVERRVVNNTMWNVQAGLLSPSGAGSIAVVNNIFGARSTSEGRDLFFERSALASASEMRNNLFGDSEPRIQWGDGQVVDLAAFQAASGKGQNSQAADPVFVALESGDFHLAPGSPAVDAGTLDEVYATFFDRYGISIVFDADGLERPWGRAIDLGAFERGINIWSDGFESGDSSRWSSSVGA